MFGDLLPSMQGRKYDERQMLPFVLRIKASVDSGQTVRAAIELRLVERTSDKKVRPTRRERKSAAEAVRRRYYEWLEHFHLQGDLQATMMAAASELGLSASTIEAIGAPREVDAYRNPIEYRVKPKRGRPRKSA